jgi:hypothetical protein
MMVVGIPTRASVSIGYRIATWKSTMIPPMITTPMDIRKPLNHTNPLFLDGDEKMSADDPTK